MYIHVYIYICICSGYTYACIYIHASCGVGAGQIQGEVVLGIRMNGGNIPMIPSLTIAMTVLTFALCTFHP